MGERRRKQQVKEYEQRTHGHGQWGLTVRGGWDGAGESNEEKGETTVIEQ